MKKNYFTNKNILITGISGFVGTHLAKKLQSLGANVYGISRSNNSKNVIKGDIQDYDLINAFIKKSKIKICFHLAAESLVESGQNDPYHTFKVNLQGTLNILEAANRNKLQKIIVASTAHVYGNSPVPYLEEYTPKPSRPYETSKACTDLVAQSYADSFNLPAFIPRFVNIYGPGDLNFGRLIPKTIKSLLHNKRPEMWGGRALRDYLFIDDAIDAYIKLAAADTSRVGPNRIFNFGSGNKISVEDLIKTIIDISKKQIKIKKISDERTSEIQSQYVSYAKARKVLGWKPKTEFDNGLSKSIAWYTKYFERNPSLL